MMVLCRTVHNLLGFPDPHCHRSRYSPPPDAGGGLRLIAGQPPKDRHVVDSSSVGPAPRERPDPGAWGLREAEVGRGIALCTENLGSESCDDGGVVAAAGEETAGSPRNRGRTRRTERKREFPPPLPWLTGGGGRRRCCFMKGERRDGRFLLREVTIERPEVLLASRQNGRLRLHLVRSDDSDEDEPDDGEKEKEEVEEWDAVGPATAGGARCQVAVSGNHNHMQMWWGHRFVTTA